MGVGPREKREPAGTGLQTSRHLGVSFFQGTLCLLGGSKGNQQEITFFLGVCFQTHQYISKSRLDMSPPPRLWACTGPAGKGAKVLIQMYPWHEKNLGSTQPGRGGLIRRTCQGPAWLTDWQRHIATSAIAKSSRPESQGNPNKVSSMLCLIGVFKSTPASPSPLGFSNWRVSQSESIRPKGCVINWGTPQNG